MPDSSLEEVIQEEDFVHLLRTQAARYLGLCGLLTGQEERNWKKKHYHRLYSESDDLETFLDDYGAQHNKRFHYFRELVASMRWFSQTGFSLVHLDARLTTYGLDRTLGADATTAEAGVRRACQTIRASIENLLRAIVDEAEQLGVHSAQTDLSTEEGFVEPLVRVRLPRSLGQEDPEEEDQKIAEVASKYLAACGMLADLSIDRIADPARRREFLDRHCREEQARVYEATVHNLQSTYDTYIKNTVIESKDDRLTRLRGHTSGSLHLLEAVTFLTHFVERHESGLRSEDAEQRMRKVIDPNAIQDVTLNELLYWANRFLQSGREIAEDLLPSYTNVREMTVALPEELQLHARPAALIVSIVGRYGTPVEFEVESKVCNAGSILELLVTVGSHPDARRFVVRGDEKPLRDIALLFEHGLGEGGIETLPERLQYLRGDA